MKCKNCGQEMIDGVYRCMNCGAFAPDPYSDSDGKHKEEDDFFITDKINNSAVQSVSKTRNQTDPLKILKPIIICLVCVIAVCAVVLIILQRPSASKAEQTTAPSSQGVTAPNVQNQQQAIADEHLQQNNVNTPEYKAYSCEGFVALLSNSFYMTCSVPDSSGAATNFSIAVSGSNSEISYDMDSMNIALMNLDGETYLVDPKNNKYVNASKAMLSMMGVSDEDLSFDMMWPDKNTKFTFEDTQYDSKDAVCCTYTDSDGVLTKIYIVDSNVVDIDSCDSSGNAVSSIKVSGLTGTIPADQLTLNGKQSAGMMDFITSLMN